MPASFTRGCVAASGPHSELGLIVGMRKAGLLGWVVVAACGSTDATVDPGAATMSTSEAIVNGAADTTHDAVVTVISSAGKDEISICTGTIVKIDAAAGTGWVATAAHCMAEGAPQVVWEGPSYSGAGRTRHTPLGYAVDTRFDIDKPENGYDFAVVRIDKVTAATPLIPLAGVPDGLAVGTSIDNIGFGRTTHPPAAADDNTTRRIVTKAISTVSDRLLAYDSSASGACQGDSGGPWLLGSGSAARVVGIDSYGNTECNGDATAGRVQIGYDFFAKELGLDAPEACTYCKAIAESAGGKCTAKRDDALATCECSDACSTECGATQACAGLSKCALPSFTSAASCSTCIDGACCAEAKACAADADCNSCITGSDSGPTCPTNDARLKLDACMQSHCSDACATKLLGSDPAPVEADAGPMVVVVHHDGGCAIGPIRPERRGFVGAFALMAFVLFRRRRRS